LQSLLNNKEALQEYTELYDDKLPYDVYPLIKSRSFWFRVEGLRELLRPLNVALKMSESHGTHLGHVLDRWKNILSHLLKMQKDYPSLTDFVQTKRELGGYSYRYERQVRPIHIVAFYLSPENIAHQPPDAHERTIFDFLDEYTPLDKRVQVREEYI
jgi:hypothetical protein